MIGRAWKPVFPTLNLLNLIGCGSVFTTHDWSHIGCPAVKDIWNQKTSLFEDLSSIGHAFKTRPLALPPLYDVNLIHVNPENQSLIDSLVICPSAAQTWFVFSDSIKNMLIEH